MLLLFLFHEAVILSSPFLNSPIIVLMCSVGFLSTYRMNE